jgi:hypothetical protein
MKYRLDEQQHSSQLTQPGITIATVKSCWPTQQLQWYKQTCGTTVQRKEQRKNSTIAQPEEYGGNYKQCNVTEAEGM